MCNDHFARGRRPKGVSRRDVLKLSAASIFALGPIARVLPTANAAPISKKRMVVINLFGGNDTLNTVIPHTLTPYFERRGDIAIKNEDSLPLTGGPGNATYRLHPEMTRVQSLWNDGDVAFVQRTGYPDANLSHFESMDVFSRGVREEFPPGTKGSGWIARFAERNAPTPLGAVSLGVGRPFDFSGGMSKPFIGQSLAGFKLYGGTGPTDSHRARTVQRVLEKLPDGASNTIAARDALEQTYTLTKQIQESVEAYSSEVDYSYLDPTRNVQVTAGVGERLRDMATLIQSGFETSVFFTGYSGFDTHSAQLSRQGELISQLDRSLGAFAEDMKAMGTWNDMVICVVTEFGRRNHVNGSVGSDHGHAYCTMLLGGAVRGGMYGPDLTEADLNVAYPLHAVDFRDIYREVMRDHMKATDLDHVFPETRLPNPLGLIG